MSDPITCPSCSSPQTYRINLPDSTVDYDINGEPNPQATYTKLNSNGYYGNAQTPPIPTITVGHCGACAHTWAPIQ